VAYDPDRTIKKEFVVDANYGESQHFYVELWYEWCMIDYNVR
jgi:hypothetical protein